MERKIKLIWDFHGMDAQKTAEHHVHHLKEFLAKRPLNNDITGFESLAEMHAIAFLVADESEMIEVRDALMPHRAVVYASE